MNFYRNIFSINGIDHGANVDVVFGKCKFATLLVGFVDFKETWFLRAARQGL